MSEIKLSDFPDYIDSILQQLKEHNQRISKLEGKEPPKKKRKKKPVVEE